MTHYTLKPGDTVTVVAADAPAGANASTPPASTPNKMFGLFGGKRSRKGPNGRKENNAVTRKQGGGKRKMSGYFKFMQSLALRPVLLTLRRRLESGGVPCPTPRSQSIKFFA